MPAAGGYVPAHYKLLYRDVIIIIMNLGSCMVKTVIRGNGSCTRKWYMVDDFNVQCSNLYRTVRARGQGVLDRVEVANHILNNS